MKLLNILATVLGFGAATVSTAGAPWPDLPSNGFIEGRLATVDDVKRGDAVFAQQAGGTIALNIVIPQYALWRDEKGTPHPMIVVQAEQGPDRSEIVGLRGFDGSETVATLGEVKLLGTRKPVK